MSETPRTQANPEHASAKEVAHFAAVTDEMVRIWAERGWLPVAEWVDGEPLFAASLADPSAASRLLDAPPMAEWSEREVRHLLGLPSPDDAPPAD
jgi:hypothetical protein